MVTKLFDEMVQELAHYKYDEILKADTKIGKEWFEDWYNNKGGSKYYEVEHGTKSPALDKAFGTFKRNIEKYHKTIVKMSVLNEHKSELGITEDIFISIKPHGRKERRRANNIVDKYGKAKDGSPLPPAVIYAMEHINELENDSK